MPSNEIIRIEADLYRQVIKLMGNRFEISVVAQNEKAAADHIQAAINEIQRIEKLLTTFNEASQTNLVNRNAGISPVKVDQEVFDLILRSKKISELTQGAFDISYGSVDNRFWNFDETMTSLPSPAIAKKQVRLINYRNIILNEAGTTVFLKEPGM